MEKNLETYVTFDAFSCLFWKHMLRLMHFGVYFERILRIKWLFSYRNNYSIVITLNEKWLFSYRNNDISCTHAWGADVLEEKRRFGASWCIF